MTTADRTDDALDTALAYVNGEVARCDSKASLLLALAGAGLAVSDDALRDLSTAPARAAGVVGVAALVAAVVTLLLVVLPRTGGNTGWPRWAALSAQEIRDQVAEDHRAELIRVLSTLAAAKFAKVRVAVLLLLAAVGALSLARLAELAG